ncbi:unnamed protein product [Caenorhabditis sp. 36 PRJEB53466]|nr:unnamed protein product [Caenorhabditis sp. 36 PRJEB53466]
MTQFNALLLDIEGTITSISFVKDELFPYAFDNVEKYLEEHYDEPGTQIILEDLRRVAQQQAESDVSVLRIREPKQECIEDVTRNVRHWIKRDKKLTPLKALQGLIWEEAYHRREVKGHIYPDVLPILQLLKDRNIPIYIYSSGSVHAQKLLFAHSVEGDMTKILEGYFDTNIGLKGESNSYKKISEQIGIAPKDILFLTDVESEAEAATKAGLQTRLVIRDGNASLTQEAKDTYGTIEALDEILMIARCLLSQSSAFVAHRGFCTSRPSSSIIQKVKKYILSEDRDNFDAEKIRKAHERDQIDEKEWTLIYKDIGASPGAVVFAVDVYTNSPGNRFDFVQKLVADAEELGTLVAIPSVALAVVIGVLIRVQQLRLIRIYQNKKDVEQFIAIRSRGVITQYKEPFRRDESTGFYFAEDQTDGARVVLHFLFGNVQIGNQKFIVMDEMFRANNYKTYMLNETSVPPRL